MLVHDVPLPEVWSWKARPYAASQRSTIWLMAAVTPRSTWSHCGSLNVLDQRVPVLPSTAADAGVPAFSTDDAVAGRPCDSSVAASASGGDGTATTAVAASTPAASRFEIFFAIFIGALRPTSRRRPAATAGRRGR